MKKSVLKDGFENLTYQIRKWKKPSWLKNLRIRTFFELVLITLVLYANNKKIKKSFLFCGLYRSVITERLRFFVMLFHRNVISLTFLVISLISRVNALSIHVKGRLEKKMNIPKAICKNHVGRYPRSDVNTI